MTLMAILGAAIYSLTSSSTTGELLANQNKKAYELARAGIRYGASLGVANLPQTTFKLPDDDHVFILQITAGVISSTGIVNAGTFREARRKIIY